jgi:hypothetical protein
MLTLPEELLLLTIHQEKGTYIGWAADHLNIGLAGAVLAQLALHGKIQIDANHRVSVIHDEPVGDELADETLKLIKESEKNRKIGYWINTLAGKGEKYRKHIIESLEAKGVLTQEEDHLVWVVPAPFHTEGSAPMKYWLKHRLRAIVLADFETNPAEAAFLSLVRACNMLDLLFLKDERRYASTAIYELQVRSAMTDPICQAVQEIVSTIATVVEED